MIINPRGDGKGAVMSVSAKKAPVPSPACIVPYGVHMNWSAFAVRGGRPPAVKKDRGLKLDSIRGN